jgi:spore germination protein YaaH
MSDLDEKLLNGIYAGVSINKIRDIPKNSTNWFKATGDGDVYELVIDSETIKQAFIDEGWVNTKSVGFQGFTVENIMTGQEWYDRFDQNLKGKIFAFDENGSEKIIAAVNACHEAAKKAAGIE